MYEKIKEEIKQAYYQQNFSNDGQRFIAWYLRNVHLRDQNQAKYDTTDGKDDKQIDAVVIDDDNSIVYIVQGKFIGSDKVDAQPLREVLSSWLQLKEPVRLQEGANERLKPRLSEISTALKDDYTIIFELITTANLTENARADLKIFQEQLAKDEELSASLNLIDSEELKRRYEVSLEHEVLHISHSITLGNGKFLSCNVAETHVVLAAIPCYQFFKSALLTN